jgi:RimJ/RimL family protein N-acetyltransferase
MSTALHLAKPVDMTKLMPLVAAFHTEMQIDSDETMREAGILPLLDGSPLGAVYLMGPTRAPIGYAVITFGWSVEFGGMDAFIDEIFVRPGVRGRGMALDALISLRNMLKSVGVTAVHLEVDQADEATQRLYRRAHFKPRERYMMMTQRL